MSLPFAEVMNSNGDTMTCESKRYSMFLLSTVVLLVIGFVLGHISQSSGRLFKVLTKFFIYLCLPCLAFNTPNVITTNTDVPSFVNSSYITKEITTNVVTSFLMWAGTVGIFGLVAWCKKDRNILLHGALSAQFIIHGNDLVFGKQLLESSCYLVTDKIPKKINFNFLELPDILVSFLIFLPLTNGIVTMSKKPLSFHNFGMSVISQAGKMGLSYLALALGTIMSCFVTTKNLTSSSYFELSIDVTSFCEVMMTLLTGVYLYHILINMELGVINAKLCVSLILLTNFGFGLVGICVDMIYACYDTSNTNCTTSFSDDAFDNHNAVLIFISSICTPSSLYIQYYILKHTSKTANYVLSYVGTIFMGTILIYVVILVEGFFSAENPIPPANFYNESQRFAVLVIGVLALIPAAMMFIRPTQSKLRTAIMLIIISHLYTRVLQAAYFSYSESHSNRSRYVTTLYFSVLTSGVSMVHYIFSNTMVGVMMLYQYYPIIGRNLKGIVWTVFSVSTTVAVILYGCVYAYLHYHFEVKHSQSQCTVEYNYNDVFLLLDIKIYEHNSPTYSKHFGSISYCILAVLISVFYFVVIALSRRNSANINLNSSECLLPDLLSQSGALCNTDSDDQEKYSPLKIFFYYTLSTILIGQVWTIADLTWKSNSLKSSTDTKEIAALRIIELGAMVMTDLSSLVLSLVFCISPRHMDREFVRLMYYPRCLKYRFQKLNRSEEVDARNLSLIDADRCRKFLLYHRQTFINLYIIPFNQKLLQFKGSALTEFLLDTEVAESLVEAVDISNSYLKGGIFMRPNPITGVKLQRSASFAGYNSYVLKDMDDLPDFMEVISRIRLSF